MFSLVPWCSGCIMNHLRRHGVEIQDPWPKEACGHQGLFTQRWKALVTPNRSKEKQNTQLAKASRRLPRVPTGLEAGGQALSRRPHTGTLRPRHSSLSSENLQGPPPSSCLHPKKRRGTRNGKAGFLPRFGNLNLIPPTRSHTHTSINSLTNVPCTHNLAHNTHRTRSRGTCLG